MLLVDMVSTGAQASLIFMLNAKSQISRLLQAQPLESLLWPHSDFFFSLSFFLDGVNLVIT